ncbi:MAG: type II secretion system F family protein [Acidimicrobiia bacterium]|nr:type II secretion system F family protein [Acidimicrobiia bacterium]
MTARALVLAWPALVVTVGWRRAPRRAPVLPRAPVVARPPTGGARGPSRQVVLVVGATAALLVIAPVMAPVPVLAAVLLPRVRATRQRVHAEAQVAADLPDVVDLLALAAGAGLTPVLAVEAVGARSTGPLGQALADAHRRMQLGDPPAAALRELPAHTAHPDAVRPLARALATAVEEGVPFEPTLRRVATDVRARRQRDAEEAARRVPVRMLFPLVACTLPAFVLLTVVPLLVTGLRDLTP